MWGRSKTERKEVRSLADKMNELGALTRMQWVYWEGNIIFFSEIWLQEQL